MTPGQRTYATKAVGTLAPSGPSIALPEKIELRAILVEETLRCCVAGCSQGMRAIVLTGSLARDEATFVREANHWRLAGDADVFLVQEESIPLLSDAALQSLAGEIGSNLAARGIQAHVAPVSVRPQYLRRLVPGIATYELRTCGQVLWGDPHILSLIRGFAVTEIPKEDAWRMLCNRMIEFLEQAPEISSAHPDKGLSLHYATVKLILDTATSYLVFAGSYEPTFHGRAEKLRALANGAWANAAAPLPLKEFAEHVSHATEWKLSGRMEERDLRRELGEEAVNYARSLWRWELEQLTGAGPGLENASLWKRWAHRQTARERARGWLSLARRRGWHRSWRSWVRWAPLSLRATPRYWIYRAAGELLWLRPCRVGHDGEPPGGNVSWEELLSFLPEPAPRTPAGEHPWRQMAREVVWNYRQFLLGTDA